MPRLLSIAWLSLTACGTTAVCQPGSCPAGQHCVFVGAATAPACLPACDAADAGACTAGTNCGCGGSCAGCENCVAFVCQ